LNSSTYREKAPQDFSNRILAFMPMLAGHNKIVETKQNILPPCIYVYAHMFSICWGMAQSRQQQQKEGVCVGIPYTQK